MPDCLITFANAGDKDGWNHYVENHVDASPYHRFEWGESVASAYGHRPHYFLAKDEAGHIVGILPTIEMLLPFGKSFLSSLPFCDTGFCLSDDNTITLAMLRHVEAFCDVQKTRYFEYRSTDKQENPTATTADNDIPSGAKVRMMLPLPESSEVLLKGFKSKLRSQINKAKKNGLSVTVNSGTEQVDAFYDIFQRNMRMLGSPVHSKNWFKEVLSHYGDNAVMSIVYKDSIPIGCGIVLRNNQTYSIPWASTRAEYNRLAPNMLLYWSLLEYASDNQGTSFDFGRSSMNEGTYKFKKQWGATPSQLDWKIYTDGSYEADDAAKEKGTVRKAIEAVWPKLPLSMTVVLGSAVRKYISL